MEDVQSKYTGNVVSVTTTAVDISSKAKLDVISQTNSTIMSMACKAPGAENIIAMAGAFKGCILDDWKKEKEQILRNQI